MAETRATPFRFDLDGTLVDSVYEDPQDLFRHLDEIGVRRV